MSRRARSAHTPTGPRSIPAAHPLYGVPTIPSFPFSGSAIVYWDGGPQTPVAPILNIPNRAGADPHSFPRNTVAARQQKSDYLLDGVVTDVCGDTACRTDNYG
jgi:hypothetical protein